MRQQGLGEVDLRAIVGQEDGDLLLVALEAVDRQAELHSGLLVAIGDGAERPAYLVARESRAHKARTWALRH
jgi:hypothetical protein